MIRLKFKNGNFMNPEQSEGNPIEVRDASDKPKKLKVNFKSKKLKILAIALAGIILVGGVVSVLVVRGIYNRPQNVVATALGNYLLDGKDKKFDATFDVGLADTSSGIKSANVKLGVQTSGKTVQLDLEADLSVLVLKGAVQSNENGNIYLQVKDLQAILGSGATQIPGLTDEMKQQLGGLDSKWIEITEEDMTALTGQEPGTSGFDKCLDGIYSAIDDQKLGDQADKAYRNNKFILAKSSNEEVVDGKKLLKVEVGLDKDKLKAFVKDLAESDKVKDLVGKCGLSEPDDSAPEDQSDPIKDGKLVVWVDRGKKQLVKLETSWSSASADKRYSKATLTVDVKEPSSKLEAPKEVVNIKDLMQTFGISPEMFSSPASAE